MSSYRGIQVVLCLLLSQETIAHARAWDVVVDFERSRAGRAPRDVPTVTPNEPPDAESFRVLMLTWAATMEARLGAEPHASRVIQDMSEEAMHAWFDLSSRRPQVLPVLLRDLESSSGRSQPRAAALTPNAALFAPDYPPDTVAYRSTVFDPLQSLGLVSSLEDRCDTAAVAEKYQVWEGLREIADDADIACVIAGCDPTGVACAVACAIIEGAKLAAKIALRPLELCEVHDGNVDAAEIEAAYENSVAIFTELGAARDEILAQVQTSEQNILNEIRSDRDFTLRLEIEKALRDDTRLASFFLPEAEGGHLSLVREIVVETIAAVLASGEGVVAANKRLADGDAAAAKGRYKDAFHYYAQAYFQAVFILGDVQ